MKIVKNFHLTLVFISVGLSLYAQGVNFSRPSSWSELLKQAKIENKYIFIDGYATWCKPCKMMDETVYSNPKVGKFMNGKFISVKIQSDQSGEDDEYIKSWYKESEMLTTKYKMDALPALLFLSPEGELLYRKSGYFDMKSFIGLAEFATDPESQKFHSKVDNYENGIKDYQQLPALAKVVSDVMLNDSLATTIRRDYIDNYINKLKKRSEIITHANLEFALENVWLLSPNNKLITELRKWPAAVSDSLANLPGATVTLLSEIVKKDELDWKLCPAGKILDHNPDWNKLQKIITKKYPQVDVKNVIELFQMEGSVINRNGFWFRTKNWAKINEYFIRKVAEYREKKDWFAINQICWFNYYVKITDRPSLELAAQWMDSCLVMVPRDTTISKSDYANFYLDTKACILYKLGRRQEAIATEEKALKIVQDFNIANNQPKDKQCRSIITNIDTMKAGEKIVKVPGGPAVYPQDWQPLD